MPKRQPESTYRREELLAAAASFGVSPALMAGALRLAGKDVLTRREVEAAIRRFKERRV